MDDARWSILVDDLLDATTLSDADRAMVSRDLNAIASHLGMRAAPPEIIAERLDADTGPGIGAKYLTIRDQMSPFSPFTFTPLREVVSSMILDGHLANPDMPIVEATNTRVRGSMAWTLRAPHFSMLLKACEGDVVEFFKALGSTDGFILDHGTMPVLSANNTITCQFRDFHWPACKYFMKGFSEGIVDHLGAHGTVEARVLHDTAFDIVIHLDE